MKRLVKTFINMMLAISLAAPPGLAGGVREETLAPPSWAQRVGAGVAVKKIIGAIDRDLQLRRGTKERGPVEGLRQLFEQLPKDHRSFVCEMYKLLWDIYDLYEETRIRIPWEKYFIGTPFEQIARELREVLFKDDGRWFVTRGSVRRMAGLAEGLIGNLSGKERDTLIKELAEKFKEEYLNPLEKLDKLRYEEPGREEILPELRKKYPDMKEKVEGLNRWLAEQGEIMQVCLNMEHHGTFFDLANAVDEGLLLSTDPHIVYDMHYDRDLAGYGPPCGKWIDWCLGRLFSDYQLIIVGGPTRPEYSGIASVSVDFDYLSYYGESFYPDGGIVRELDKPPAGGAIKREVDRMMEGLISGDIDIRLFSLAISPDYIWAEQAELILDMLIEGIKTYVRERQESDWYQKKLQKIIPPVEDGTSRAVIDFVDEAQRTKCPPVIQGMNDIELCRNLYYALEKPDSGPGLPGRQVRPEVWWGHVITVFGRSVEVRDLLHEWLRRNKKREGERGAKFKGLPVDEEVVKEVLGDSDVEAISEDELERIGGRLAELAPRNLNLPENLLEVIRGGVNKLIRAANRIAVDEKETEEVLQTRKALAMLFGIEWDVDKDRRLRENLIKRKEELLAEVREFLEYTRRLAVGEPVPELPTEVSVSNVLSRFGDLRLRREAFFKRFTPRRQQDLQYFMASRDQHTSAVLLREEGCYFLGPVWEHLDSAGDDVKLALVAHEVVEEMLCDKGLPRLISHYIAEMFERFILGDKLKGESRLDRAINAYFERPWIEMWLGGQLRDFARRVPQDDMMRAKQRCSSDVGMAELMGRLRNPEVMRIFGFTERDLAIITGLFNRVYLISGRRHVELSHFISGFSGDKYELAALLNLYIDSRLTEIPAHPVEMGVPNEGGFLRVDTSRIDTSRRMSHTTERIIIPQGDADFSNILQQIADGFCEKTGQRLNRDRLVESMGNVTYTMRTKNQLAVGEFLKDARGRRHIDIVFSSNNPGLEFLFKYHRKTGQIKVNLSILEQIKDPGVVEILIAVGLIGHLLLGYNEENFKKLYGLHSLVDPRTREKRDMSVDGVLRRFDVESTSYMFTQYGITPASFIFNLTKIAGKGQTYSEDLISRFYAKGRLPLTSGFRDVKCEGGDMSNIANEIRAKLYSPNGRIEFKTAQRESISPENCRMLADAISQEILSVYLPLKDRVVFTNGFAEALGRALQCSFDNMWEYRQWAIKWEITPDYKATFWIEYPVMKRREDGLDRLRGLFDEVGIEHGYNSPWGMQTETLRVVRGIPEGGIIQSFGAIPGRPAGFMSKGVSPGEVPNDKLTPVSPDEVKEAIDSIKGKLEAKRGREGFDYIDGYIRALDRLKAQQKIFKFDAIVNGPKEYLLGFADRRGIALCNEFFEKGSGLNTVLDEALFHELHHLRFIKAGDTGKVHQEARRLQELLFDDESHYPQGEGTAKERGMLRRHIHELIAGYGKDYGERPPSARETEGIDYFEYTGMRPSVGLEPADVPTEELAELVVGDELMGRVIEAIRDIEGRLPRLRGRVVAINPMAPRILEESVKFLYKLARGESVMQRLYGFSAKADDKDKYIWAFHDFRGIAVSREFLDEGYSKFLSQVLFHLAYHYSAEVVWGRFSRYIHREAIMLERIMFDDEEHYRDVEGRKVSVLAEEVQRLVDKRIEEAVILLTRDMRKPGDKVDLEGSGKGPYYIYSNYRTCSEEKELAGCFQVELPPGADKPHIFFYFLPEFTNMLFRKEVLTNLVNAVESKGIGFKDPHIYTNSPEVIAGVSGLRIGESGGFVQLSKLPKDWAVHLEGMLLIKVIEGARIERGKGEVSVERDNVPRGMYTWRRTSVFWLSISDWLIEDDHQKFFDMVLNAIEMILNYPEEAVSERSGLKDPLRRVKRALLKGLDGIIFLPRDALEKDFAFELKEMEGGNKILFVYQKSKDVQLSRMGTNGFVYALLRSFITRQQMAEISLQEIGGGEGRGLEELFEGIIRIEEERNQERMYSTTSRIGDSRVWVETDQDGYIVRVTRDIREPVPFCFIERILPDARRIIAEMLHRQRRTDILDRVAPGERRPPPAERPEPAPLQPVMINIGDLPSEVRVEISANLNVSGEYREYKPARIRLGSGTAREPFKDCFRTGGILETPGKEPTNFIFEAEACYKEVSRDSAESSRLCNDFMAAIGSILNLPDSEWAAPFDKKWMIGSFGSVRLEKQEPGNLKVEMKLVKEAGGIGNTLLIRLPLDTFEEMNSDLFIFCLMYFFSFRYYYRRVPQLEFDRALLLEPPLNRLSAIPRCYELYDWAMAGIVRLQKTGGISYIIRVPPILDDYGFRKYEQVDIIIDRGGSVTVKSGEGFVPLFLLEKHQPGYRNYVLRLLEYFKRSQGRRGEGFKAYIRHDIKGYARFDPREGEVKRTPGVEVGIDLFEDRGIILPHEFWDKIMGIKELHGDDKDTIERIIHECFRMRRELFDKERGLLKKVLGRLKGKFSLHFIDERIGSRSLFGDHAPNGLGWVNLPALGHLMGNIEDERLKTFILGIILGIGLSHEILGHESGMRGDELLTLQDAILTAEIIRIVRYSLSDYIEKLEIILEPESPYIKQLKAIDGLTGPGERRGTVILWDKDVVGDNFRPADIVNGVISNMTLGMLEDLLEQGKFSIFSYDKDTPDKMKEIGRFFVTWKNGTPYIYFYFEKPYSFFMLTSIEVMGKLIGAITERFKLDIHRVQVLVKKSPVDMLPVEAEERVVLVPVARTDEVTEMPVEIERLRSAVARTEIIRRSVKGEQGKMAFLSWRTDDFSLEMMQTERFSDDRIGDLFSILLSVLEKIQNFQTGNVRLRKRLDSVKSALLQDIDAISFIPWNLEEVGELFLEREVDEKRLVVYFNIGGPLDLFDPRNADILTYVFLKFFLEKELGMVFSLHEIADIAVRTREPDGSDAERLLCEIIEKGEQGMGYFKAQFGEDINVEFTISGEIGRLQIGDLAVSSFFAEKALPGLSNMVLSLPINISLPRRLDYGPQYSESSVGGQTYKVVQHTLGDFSIRLAEDKRLGEKILRGMTMWWDGLDTIFNLSNKIPGAEAFKKWLVRLDSIVFDLDESVGDIEVEESDERHLLVKIPTKIKGSIISQEVIIAKMMNYFLRGQDVSISSKRILEEITAHRQAGRPITIDTNYGLVVNVDRQGWIEVKKDGKTIPIVLTEKAAPGFRKSILGLPGVDKRLKKVDRPDAGPGRAGAQELDDEGVFGSQV